MARDRSHSPGRIQELEISGPSIIGTEMGHRQSIDTRINVSPDDTRPETAQYRLRLGTDPTEPQ